MEKKITWRPFCKDLLDALRIPKDQVKKVTIEASPGTHAVIIVERYMTEGKSAELVKLFELGEQISVSEDKTDGV